MIDRLYTVFIIVIVLGYIGCGIMSFGHSAQRATTRHDFTALMNSITLGVAWPFYAAYIYFDEEQLDD